MVLSASSPLLFAPPPPPLYWCACVNDIDTPLPHRGHMFLCAAILSIFTVVPTMCCVCRFSLWCFYNVVSALCILVQVSCWNVLCCRHCSIVLCHVHYTLPYDVKHPLPNKTVQNCACVCWTNTCIAKHCVTLCTTDNYAVSLFSQQQQHKHALGKFRANKNVSPATITPPPKKNIT